MRSVVLVSIIFSLLLFSACANKSKAEYEDELASWVGSTEREMYLSWGKPDDVFIMSENEKQLIYIRSNTISTATTTRIPIGGGLLGGLGTMAFSSGGPVTSNCKVNYTLTNGIVTNWRWEGNVVSMCSPSGSG